ncbi:flagellar basal-body MS-ring/collar protein FliF [Tateyamaria sp. ANG-S1]|uniref:flagellar basal-body MS-ring/collar protein FliF n=1 Tax=Tateyamaria sp. ANG-S1 TaxID=1577905 RepID=UPI00057E59BD|nr:flagellar basal-body MS-ring/collar protein FliF [Tateyamaria sp. ANG-S1]KIC49623.1 flagellar M-ring protein FliF [Tateyamaria sp. ANG-S1]
MQQLLNVWMGLDIKRQVTVVVATVAMFLAILAMSRVVTAPTMTLLYAGLENGAAGDVVRALEQRGVAFEVRGGSIFVDSKERDHLRLTLASEGLPANSSQGYELLDSLSGFGTTSQMFDAAYWRAKEGELARTIVSSPHVAMARVHIASTGSNPFQRSVTPTASVAITPNGGEFSAQQAKAVRFLVASAVAGLSADDVTVIDASGAVIGSGDDTSPSPSSDDKSQMLRERVERLLEARVGPGNAIVEVSVDTVTETEEIRERRFDPQERVVISTDTEERTSTSNEAGNGDVTVASNLPDGEGGGGENSSSQNSETRERINYEVSETERAIVKSAGAIRRITVAVLVNEVLADEESGETPTARSEEELDALRELVASAVGYDEARGDVITIKAMALKSVVPQGTSAETSLFDGVHLDLMSAIQMAILASVTLILGLFVVKPVLTRSSSAVGALHALPPTLPGDGLENAPEFSAEHGELPEIDMAAAPEMLPDLPALSSGHDGVLPAVVSEDPVDRLRSMIGDRQEETVEILRSWLEEERA